MRRIARVDDIRETEWILQEMIYFVDILPKAMNSVASQDITYDERHHRVSIVTEVDDVWLFVNAASLPVHAVFHENLYKDKNRHGLGYRHVRYPQWWELTKQLCRAARDEDDVSVVRRVLTSVREVCSDHNAFLLSEKLPWNICSEISMLSGGNGTQGAAELALHFCLDRPKTIALLLDEGSPDPLYWRRNLFVCKACAVEGKHDQEYEEVVLKKNVLAIFGVDQPRQRRYVNKRMADYFGLFKSNIILQDLDFLPIQV
jgi:hypothetical protein